MTFSNTANEIRTLFARNGSYDMDLLYVSLRWQLPQANRFSSLAGWTKFGKPHRLGKSELQSKDNVNLHTGKSELQSKDNVNLHTGKSELQSKDNVNLHTGKLDL
jgi:hypothetical protein